jgi:hypothetical protein
MNSNVQDWAVDLRTHYPQIALFQPLVQDVLCAQYTYLQRGIQRQRGYKRLVLQLAAIVQRHRLGGDIKAHNAAAITLLLCW